MNNTYSQYASQPVIAHYGGYQAQNSQNSIQPNYSSQMNAYSQNASQPVISHYGGYQAQNSQQNGYSQQGSLQSSQPVIAHYGYSSH
ncbi:hypothetical protein D3C86_1889810 [compost metagenome]